MIIYSFIFNVKAPVYRAIISPTTGFTNLVRSNDYCINLLICNAVVRFLTLTFVFNTTPTALCRWWHIWRADYIIYRFVEMMIHMRSRLHNLPLCVDDYTCEKQTTIPTALCRWWHTWEVDRRRTHPKLLRLLLRWEFLYIENNDESQFLYKPVTL